MTLRNLITNPSFETDVSGWTTVLGPTQVFEVSSDWSAEGDSSAHVKSAQPASDSGTYSFDAITSSYFPCTPGTTASMRAMVNIITLAANAHSGPRIVFTFADDDLNTLLQSSNYMQQTTGEQLATYQATVPEGATFVRPGIRFCAAIGPPLPEMDFEGYVDAAMFMLGATPPDWPAYHDGDSPGWQWDGTPNASTSSAIAAPTIALPTRLNMRMANTTHLKIRG